MFTRLLLTKPTVCCLGQRSKFYKPKTFKEKKIGGGRNERKKQMLFYVNSYSRKGKASGI